MMTVKQPLALPLRQISIAAMVAMLGACGGGGSGGSNAPFAYGFGPAPAPAPAPSSPPPPAFDPGKPVPFKALAQALPDSATERQKHMQIAEVSWENNDDIIYPKFCFAPGTGSDPALSDRTVVPYTQLFDELAFMGTISVGQYVYRTPDGGFILFDTMNNAADVSNITLPQLQQAGIDPANIRAIVVTHGHGDHDGGVATLQSMFNTPPTIVGAADYTNAKSYVASTKVDSTDLRLRPITIAGVELGVMPTPGHTPGTTSYVLPVTYKGKVHKVAYWGGSAFPGTAADALKYLRSSEAMVSVIRSEGIDASINSHTFFDRTQSRIDKIRAVGLADSDPMIQGTEKVALSYSVLRACSAALLSDKDATAVNPVWRPTTTEFFAAGNGGTGLVVAARVSSFFSVVAGGTVSFATPQGGSCSASTDADGVAVCTIPEGGSGVITARFSEKAETGAVNLASAAQRTVEALK